LNYKEFLSNYILNNYKEINVIFYKETLINGNVIKEDIVKSKVTSEIENIDGGYFPKYKSSYPNYALMVNFISLKNIVIDNVVLNGYIFNEMYYSWNQNHALIPFTGINLYSESEKEKVLKLFDEKFNYKNESTIYIALEYTY
jgi:hypothetical protein